MCGVASAVQGLEKKKTKKSNAGWVSLELKWSVWWCLVNESMEIGGLSLFWLSQRQRRVWRRPRDGNGMGRSISVGLSLSLSVCVCVCVDLSCLCLSLSLGFPLDGRLNQRLDERLASKLKGDPFRARAGRGRLVGTGIIVGFGQLERREAKRGTGFVGWSR
ncbi:hypothetical protein LY76DRAFT_236731 [Colletotrichum caudatum]|nr:hypothetical protein LY76DRAFT_236731 [Colletotrichum caudatum]